jgi:uncharacterized protein (UPF0548 family)
VTVFSYADVGATEGGALPLGYRHLRYRGRVGSGGGDYRAAAGALLSWRMHRRVPVRVRADGPAVPGLRVVVGLGPVTAPCAVVWTVADATRTGFAYGTLTGHPEQGEEAFVVELDADGSVWLSVTAFSRPALRYIRAMGPLVPVFQRLYVRRCAQALRAEVRRIRT